MGRHRRSPLSLRHQKALLFLRPQCSYCYGCVNCAVSQWKKQEAYRNTAEINIYLHPEYTGKGIGSIVINHLEKFAKAKEIRTLIAGLCSENTPSKRLFEKNGYNHCATFLQVGNKFRRVLDTVYLQKLL